MCEDLKNKMNTILNDGTGVNLFFAIKNSNDEVIIKRADLEDGDTQEKLKMQFMSLLNEEFIKSEEVNIVELSSADERNKVLYHYDYSSFPENLQYFSEFNYKNKYEIFSFKDDDLLDIEAYIIVIGSQEHHCVLYKKFYPIFLIGRGGFFIKKSATRFEEFNEDILRISRDYQFIKIDENIYIKDLNVLEKFGGFKDIIENEAESAVNEIKNLDIIVEPNILLETLKLDLTFARKLGKVIKGSPVISLNIERDQIIEFSKTHPGLKGEFHYSDDKKQILLTTKKSQNTFLKLLDDSYLTSELTRQYYASLAKEKVEL
ncbi:MAG: anti-phage protein KwaB [Peptoniphilaceae bacterium]